MVRLVIASLLTLSACAATGVPCTQGTPGCEACLWSRPDGDRQLCEEGVSTCADLPNVPAGATTQGPLTASWVNACPNDPAPSEPDSTCTDADGDLVVFYDNVDEVGHDVYCGRCAAGTATNHFCP